MVADRGRAAATAGDGVGGAASSAPDAAGHHLAGRAVEVAALGAGDGRRRTMVADGSPFRGEGHVDDAHPSPTSPMTRSPGTHAP